MGVGRDGLIVRQIIGTKVEKDHPEEQSTVDIVSLRIEEGN